MLQTPGSSRLYGNFILKLKIACFVRCTTDKFELQNCFSAKLFLHTNSVVQRRNTQLSNYTNNVLICNRFLDLFHAILQATQLRNCDVGNRFQGGLCGWILLHGKLFYFEEKVVF